jgi:Alpha-glutamyl/putrescinyl thymine pyrophosphorylase clade 3
MSIITIRDLHRRLAQFQKLNKLPGLKTEESRMRLVERLVDSEKKLRALSMRRFAGSTDPSEADFHPLKAIVKHSEAGRRDEAVWLAFLTIHFGQEARETIRLFYGQFGKGQWKWELVCQDPNAVREWIASNAKKVKRLKFGNHRKYETNNPESPAGTPAVIRSFREWVKQTVKGGPYRALRVVAKGRPPKTAFENAYEMFSVDRFGRTGKFDFLCLLGNLGILRISPPHCYLADSTGPKRGALQMVTGKKRGRMTAEVETTIRRLQKHLGVSVEAMEDALCNWQKRPKPRKHASDVGYVTATCH